LANQDGAIEMTGSTRSSQGLDERRRRLLYRCWHRGTRETDLIMGPFADASIGNMSEIELTEFERLSDVPDPEIYAWVTGEIEVPPHHDTAVFRRLCAFHSNGR
jgi:antitoxin CptB